MRTLLIPAVAAALLSVLPASATEYLVYAGTYTLAGDPKPVPTGSKGIYSYRFDTSTGKLTRVGLAAETSNPSFLIEHSNHKFVYAVNEDSDKSTVTAFRIDHKTGLLTKINQVSARGSDACHLALDQTGKWLVVSDYTDGGITVIPVGDDGRLGEPKSLPKHSGASESHVHEAVFTADNRYMLLCDLGLDKIFIYHFDAQTGSLTAAKPESASVAKGAGVRHIVFHPNNKILYAISELNSTVTAFTWNSAAGTLTEFQTISTVPADFTGKKWSAEIAINRAGTVLYASNRTHDSVAMFDIDQQKFTLLPAGRFPTLGKTPRNFVLDPSGNYLLVANQESDSIVTFAVHPKTGQLTPHGPITKDIGAPVCLLFVQP